MIDGKRAPVQYGLHIFPKHSNFQLMPALIKPHAAVCAIADRAFREGVAMPDVQRRAGVPASTWLRWVHGGTPSLLVLEKLERALTEIIEKDETHG